MFDMMNEMCKLKYSHFLTVGDFNMKSINWDNMLSLTNEMTLDSVYLECTKYLFLFQHVKEPTRYRHGQEPSILDLIFTNEEEMISELKYHSSLGKVIIYS
jgi:hypothetical protein